MTGTPCVSSSSTASGALKSGSGLPASRPARLSFVIDVTSGAYAVTPKQAITSP